MWSSLSLTAMQIAACCSYTLSLAELLSSEGGLGGLLTLESRGGSETILAIIIIEP